MIEIIYKFLYNNEKVISAMGSLVTTLTIVFLICDNIFTRKQYRYSCQWQEKNKAAQLAEMYKSQILSSNAFISALFKELGIVDILKPVYNAELKLFTKEELDQFLNNNEINIIRQKLMDHNNYEKFLKCKSMILDDKTTIHLPSIEDINKDEIKSNSLKMKLMLKVYSDVIDDLLNSLEYFSMYFNTSVADESVVYQSLHQTYLRIVRSIYFEIALKNVNTKDMYYTNIINLYMRWTKYDEDMKKKLQKHNLKIIKNIRKIKK